LTESTLKKNKTVPIDPNKQAVADRADWFTEFCRRQIYAALGRMTLGQLQITLPNGEVTQFGCIDQSNNRGDESGVVAEIMVNDVDFFRRVLLFADIGLAESYMDGFWDTPDIRAVISWMLLNVENSPVLNESQARLPLLNLCGALNKLLHKSRSNTKSNSKKNIRDHYDLGNSFFEIFLDQSMTYSSGLFEEHKTTSLKNYEVLAHDTSTKPLQGGETMAEGDCLAQAQIAKYSRLAQKLRLKESDTVLEIGCGWGGFSLFAASNYGCKIKAVTISLEQFHYVKQLIASAQLDHLVQVELIDYREIVGQYDKIVSIEMIEAVGDEHLDKFFARCERLLKRQGLLGLQMITSPDSRYDTLRQNVDFIQKHIFPGSLLPSLRRVNEAMAKSGDLFLYDLHDMGPSYVKTLREWQIRFKQSLDRVRALGFGETFIRKWDYYFAYCQAAFDMRNVTVVQAVYTRPNNLNLRQPK
jgi:cyclopropane-fatty-acyl-phospholipid synthase